MLRTLWKKLGKKAQWLLVWLIHPKFNVGLSIIIPNEKGQVLIGKHVFSSVTEPWRLLGGYMNRDENIFTAAIREIKEEIGISVEPVRVLRIRSGFSYRVEITIVTKPVSFDVESIQIDKGELDTIGWFDIGSEPEGTLESHKALLKLWKESHNSHLEITNL